MNRILLATTALAIVAGAGLRPAAAQGLAVYDNTNNLQTAANFIKQITQMKQDWQTMQSQLTTMNSLFAATQHGNSTLSIGQGLSSLQSQMPGASSGYIPGMAYGSGMTSQAQQFYNQNHVYTPQGTDFAAQEMQRRQMATANMQGEVLTGLQASDQRIAELGELQQDIANNDDPTYLAATSAHIQSEQTFLANEQTKIQRLQMMQATQAQVDQQRGEQNARKEAEDMHEAAAAAAGWPTTGQGSVAANMDPADQPYMDRATAQFLGGPVSSSAPVSSVITPGDQAYMDAAAAKMLGGPVVHVSPAGQ